MNISYKNCSDLDTDTIKRQIHCKEVNCAGIIERCAHGYPRIILLNPRKHGAARGEDLNHESISNILWLTCPYLNERIHEIENRGYIDRISRFIQGERPLQEKMFDAHAHYYYVRKSIYRDFFGDLYPENEIKVFNAGIGGMRDVGSIKCLHVNFAHYRLCGDNIAGLLTSMLLNEKINCDEVLCLHAN